jgi:hypothetical protein
MTAQAAGILDSVNIRLRVANSATHDSSVRSFLEFSQEASKQ